MPVSMVSVAPFVGGKANKNNDLPLYLNFISGDSIPNDALVMDGSIAKSLGLKNGYTGVIGWGQGEDRVYNGKSRSNVRFFMLDGKSSFVDKLETAVAKEQAKASVKFAPRFTFTKKADDNATPNPADAILTPLNAELNRIEDMDTPVPTDIEALVAKARTELAKFPVELTAFLAKAKDAVGATV